MARIIRQTTRDRYLTPEEAERYRELRKKISQEMPLILERRRKSKSIGKPGGKDKHA